MPATTDSLSRRRFLAGGGLGAAGLMAASSFKTHAGYQGQVIDAHMHLEAYGEYWPGLEDQIIEHYDFAGIDKGVVFTCWTPTRQSNDRTQAACEKYPDRFIPFGHVRTEDPGWEKELERIGKMGWKGIKLHQSEISRSPDLKEKTRKVVSTAAASGIRIFLIHLADIEIINELSGEMPNTFWILPHMGSYKNSEEMKSYCKLAKNRTNLYLETSNAQYYRFGQQFEWAGLDKIIFASDGFWFSPYVEKAKIETLQLPTPFRTRKLTDKELGMILGGTLKKILES